MIYCIVLCIVFCILLFVIFLIGFSVEKKPKLDLLRTCVAAVPRLMPSSDLSISELVEMLIRYTVHIDEELRVYVHFSCVVV